MGVEKCQKQDLGVRIRIDFVLGLKWRNYLHLEAHPALASPFLFQFWLLIIYTRVDIYLSYSPRHLPNKPLFTCSRSLNLLHIADFIWFLMTGI